MNAQNWCGRQTCILRAPISTVAGSRFSLLTSVAMHGVAPYQQVLTHGFVVDADGRKMSKSAGQRRSRRIK